MRYETDNGLEKFADTWTDEEADEFDAAAAAFEEVDEELWRPFDGGEEPGGDPNPHFTQAFRPG